MTRPEASDDIARPNASEARSSEIALTAESVSEHVINLFSTLDRDANGHLSESELNRALSMEKYDSKLYKAYSAVTELLSEIEEISNDEWGDENDGITIKDLKQLRRNPRGKDERAQLEARLRKLENTENLLPDLTIENASAATAARAIRKATKQDQLIDTGTDEETIHATLANLSESERQSLKTVYKRLYGESLEKMLDDEMSGAEHDRSINLLNRKDGIQDDAGFFHESLVELGQWTGRSNKTINKALRDKLSTMSAKEIETANTEYKDRYGRSLNQALFSCSKLSTESKEALSIYWNGVDHLSDDDSLRLADIALNADDIEMFEESMRNASKEARERFIREGGEERVRERFSGRWYNALLNVSPVIAPFRTGRITNTDLRHALDYMKDGKLLAATIVRDNDTILGDNEEAIDAALEQLDESERIKYRQGRAIAMGQQVEWLSGMARQEAIEYYEELHGQLKDAGFASEVARWEEMIVNPHEHASAGETEHDDSKHKAKRKFSLTNLKGAKANEIMETILASKAEDRQRLTSMQSASYPDTQLRQGVFGGLKENQRELAFVAAQQGHLRPEDMLRSYIVHAGVNEQQIFQTLSELDMDAKVALSKDYAAKYGSNATSDFLSRVSDKHRLRAELAIEKVDRPLADRFSDALVAHSTSRDGIGKWFVDKVWDGTGFQADQAISRYAVTAGDAARGRAVSAQRRQEVRRHLVVNLENFNESKEQAAEIATDVAIGAAAVGASCFTGFTSLALLAKLGIAGGAGAVIKVGGKSAMMGNTYKWDAEQVSLDGGRGFVYAATAFLGPHEIGHLLKVKPHGAAEYALTAASGAFGGGASGSMLALSQISREPDMPNKGEHFVKVTALSALLGTVTTVGIKAGTHALKVSFEAPATEAVKHAAADADGIIVEHAVEGAMTRLGRKGFESVHPVELMPLNGLEQQAGAH